MLALFGLKWNPFRPDVPVDALWRSPKLDHFCWRLENLVREGGFALITGDPGTGKSVALRLLAHRLAALPDVVTGVLTRPQSGLGRLLPRDGAALRRRSRPAQPLGRLQDPPRHLARPRRGHPLPARPAVRRSPGNARLRPRRPPWEEQESAACQPPRLSHSDQAGGQTSSQRRPSAYRRSSPRSASVVWRGVRRSSGRRPAARAPRLGLQATLRSLHRC